MTTMIMKSTKPMSLLLSAALLTIVVAWTSVAFAGMKYAPGTYEIDTVHTRVSFIVPHFVITQVDAPVAAGTPAHRRPAFIKFR